MKTKGIFYRERRRTQEEKKKEKKKKSEMEKQIKKRIREGMMPCNGDREKKEERIRNRRRKEM